jgi:hypothetical protein
MIDPALTAPWPSCGTARNLLKSLENHQLFGNDHVEKDANGHPELPKPCSKTRQRRANKRVRVRSGTQYLTEVHIHRRGEESGGPGARLAGRRAHIVNPLGGPAQARDLIGLDRLAAARADASGGVSRLVFSGMPLLFSEVTVLQV